MGTFEIKVEIKIIQYVHIHKLITLYLGTNFLPLLGASCHLEEAELIRLENLSN